MEAEKIKLILLGMIAGSCIVCGIRLTQLHDDIKGQVLQFEVGTNDPTTSYEPMPFILKK